MNAALLRFSESREVIEALLNHMNDGLMLTNSNREIVAINPAFERMTGYTLEEIEGKNPSVLQSGQTPRETYKDMWMTLSKKGTWTGELCNERKDGGRFWSYITITEVRKVDKEDSYYIGLMRDITIRKKQEEEMRHTAYHDTLTGLPNRLHFREKLKEALVFAAEREKHVAVLFLDLDRFKKINDSYGHQAGDDLLIECSKRLSGIVGTRGVVSRFGGDEFTIFLPNLESKKAAYQLIKDVFTAFSTPFSIRNHVLYMTTSVGMSFFPEHGEDFDTLLKNADSAMYRTKVEGRNSFQVYDKEMNELVAEELLLEIELLDAIHSGQLEVYYQLQVEIDSRRPYGMEALVRWNHPTKRVISPAVFLPIAEKMGVLAEIDEWVLNEACRQTKSWHDQGYDHLIVSVNISKKFFKKVDFVQRVKGALAESGLQPTYLCLEITENTAILQVEEIREKLNELKEFGVYVSLDDFGTGYSSLSQLKLFPIDSLKIDQSFVRDIDMNENRAIVKLIIAMANSLNVSVICEGIETEEQLKLIEEEGCSRAQGYLFSRPIPYAECEKLINSLIEGTMYK
ncbi:EAL domain-containing protein [bacterium LRH843]|nr:EAL domain-containing protein [bacterium LRH843]